jgi:hypothetical protein
MRPRVAVDRVEVVATGGGRTTTVRIVEGGLDTDTAPDSLPPAVRAALREWLAGAPEPSAKSPSGAVEAFADGGLRVGAGATLDVAMEPPSVTAKRVGFTP